MSWMITVINRIAAAAWKPLHHPRAQRANINTMYRTNPHTFSVCCMATLHTTRSLGRSLATAATAAVVNVCASEFCVKLILLNIALYGHGELIGSLATRRRCTPHARALAQHTRTHTHKQTNATQTHTHTRRAQTSPAMTRLRTAVHTQRAIALYAP